MRLQVLGVTEEGRKLVSVHIGSNIGKYKKIDVKLKVLNLFWVNGIYVCNIYFRFTKASNFY